MVTKRTSATTLVQVSLLDVLVRLHPAGLELAELRAAGVPATTLLNLYPVEIKSLTRWARATLQTPDQVRNFCNRMHTLLNGRLGNIYSSVPKVAYFKLPHAVETIKWDEHFDALCHLAESPSGVIQPENSRPAERLLKEALDSAADILALACAPDVVAKPTFGRALAESLAALKAALPAR